MNPRRVRAVAQEQYNRAVDKFYDYFEQTYGVVPIAVQNAFFEALETARKEELKLCEELIDYETKMITENPPF